MSWNIRRAALPNDRRYTLPEDIAYAKRCAGVTQFDLDVAAEPNHHVAPLWYGPLGSAEHTGWLGPDGLGAADAWAGHVWCNPPWSQKADWVQVASLTMRTSRSVRSITMILPATVDQAWWADFIEPYRDTGEALQTYFPRGRPHYGTPEFPFGEPGKSPQFATCVLVWRQS